MTTPNSATYSNSDTLFALTKISLNVKDFGKIESFKHWGKKYSFLNTRNSSFEAKSSKYPNSDNHQNNGTYLNNNTFLPHENVNIMKGDSI